MDKKFFYWQGQNVQVEHYLFDCKIKEEEKNIVRIFPGPKSDASSEISAFVKLIDSNMI